MLGSVAYPFPETTDFSAQLVRAQASGAKVLGLCMAGADTENCIKQAHEFGLISTMKIAALLIQGPACGRWDWRRRRGCGGANPITGT